MVGTLATLDRIKESEGPLLVFIRPDVALRVRYLGKCELPSEPDSDDIPLGYQPGQTLGLIGVWSETAGQWLEFTEDTMYTLLQRRRVFKVEYDDRSY